MSRSNFFFNTEKYNFWPVYDTLKKYYPLDINGIAENDFFFQYKGIKKLDKLITERVQNEKNSGETWSQKTVRWEDELRCKLISTTYGQEPSFSSYLEIEKNNYKDWIFEKRLHFAISVLGPYYTIYGSDNAALIVKGENSATDFLKKGDRYYWRPHRMVISPMLEYKKIFGDVRKLIENEFSSYKFIPYGIYSNRLNGLEVRNSDEKLNRVFHGLFNQHYDFDTPVLMDNSESSLYGYDQWEI